MRFDFHKYKSFLECPRKYKWRDERRPLITPKNHYFTVPGEFIQKFFEMYSNSWKDQGVVFTKAKVIDRMRPYWEHLLLKNMIDWSHPASTKGEAELFLESVDAIIRNLKLLDVYKDTRSEVKFEISLKSGDVLVGKVDFIHRTDKGIIISDGKNSGTKGKNVDPSQLIFYALLYKFTYGELPAGLKFIYYKFAEEEDVVFTTRDVDDLWSSFIRTMNLIKNTKEFLPTPCAKSCRYCDYLEQCPEGTVDMESRKRGPRNTKIEGLGSKSEETGVYTINL